MKKTLVVLVVVVGLLLGMAVGASAQPTEAWIPGFASLLIPGVGQFLNDEMDKAVLHFGIGVGINVAGYYAAVFLPLGAYGYPIWGLAHLAWALYSAYDAYDVAKARGFSLGLTDDGLTLAYRF